MTIDELIESFSWFEDWDERFRYIIELGDQLQDRALFNAGQARKFMQTFLIASACKDLLDVNGMETAV